MLLLSWIRSTLAQWRQHRKEQSGAMVLIAMYDLSNGGTCDINAQPRERPSLPAMHQEAKSMYMCVL